MPEELRRTFHRDLEEIERSVMVLFALVTEGLGGATDALLSGDMEAARKLAQQDVVVDRLYADVEAVVMRQFTRQSPVASDLRFLLSVMRMLPELERSGDLSEHIASRAARGVGAELSPRVRLIVQRMGEVGVMMWHATADAFAQRDATACERLREDDNELDDLLLALTAELVAQPTSAPVLMEMTLIGRFYERLGDHAVNIAERIRFLAPHA
jgi:phosphate transport system protein